MNRSINKILFATLLFVISIIVGITGYMWLEDFTFTDAAYMSVITFSTVGFNEVNPLSDHGKIFTTIFITLNLGVFAYTVSALSTFLFEGEFKKFFKHYISNREVKKLKDHVIVCGFGKNGEMACKELRASGTQFVIIEKDMELIDNFPENENYQFINGNAILDEVLISAGVEKASTIITALPEDSDNVFITLTARELNSKIRIIAKATEINSEKKLYRAGASHVVMPDKLGGVHMAQLITKPYVIEFLELLGGGDENGILLEEVSYQNLKAEYCNQTIKDLDVRNKTGATVIAFKDDIEGFLFNPHSNKTVGEGDVLILLGKEENLSSFRSIYLR